MDQERLEERRVGWAGELALAYEPKGFDLASQCAHVMDLVDEVPTPWVGAGVGGRGPGPIGCGLASISGQPQLVVDLK